MAIHLKQGSGLEVEFRGLGFRGLGLKVYGRSEREYTYSRTAGYMIDTHFLSSSFIPPSHHEVQTLNPQSGLSPKYVGPQT